MSQTKIKNLTPEQVAKLSECRDKWLKIGLSTTPCNHKKAEEAACRAYQNTGLDKPKYFLWLDSPLQGCIGASILKNEQSRSQIKDWVCKIEDKVRGQIQVSKRVEDQVWDETMGKLKNQVGGQVKDQVWSQIRQQVEDRVRDETHFGKLIDKQVGSQILDRLEDQVRDQVGDQVKDQVWDQAREQTGDEVWDQVWEQDRDQTGDQAWEQSRSQTGDQVWDQVWDGVWDQVRDQVKDQVWDQVRDQVWEQAWDQIQDQVRDLVWDQAKDQTGDQVWGPIRDRSRSRVGNQIGDQVWDQAKDQTEDQIREQIRDQVRGQVMGQIRDQVWEQAWNQIQDQVRDQLSTCLFGQHDAHWLSLYSFFLTECSFEGCQKLKPLMDLAENSGWWWPLNDIAIFTEKPIALHRDSENHLHALGEMAIEYADGFGVYAWHGIRLPAEYGALPPEKWESKWLLEEKNAEIRRVLIEGIGYERILQDLEAKELSHWKEYTLFRIQDADIEPFHLLKMTCPSTGHIHIHRIPPEIKTAKKGITWINHGIKPEQFQIQH